MFEGMFTKVFMDKLFRLRGGSRDAALDEMMLGIDALSRDAMSENPEGRLTPHVSFYFCSLCANPPPCSLRAPFLAITTSNILVRLLPPLFPPRIARPTRTFLVLFCSPPRICLHTAPIALCTAGQPTTPRRRSSRTREHVLNTPQLHCVWQHGLQIGDSLSGARSSALTGCAFDGPVKCQRREREASN